MIPDIPVIIECPHCQHQALKEILISGNTARAVHWTDGKHEAPRLPEMPRLTFCDACKQPYWVENAKEIEDGESGLSAERKATQLQRITFPSFSEYQSCLGTEIIKDRNDEIYIRIRLWWCYNDYYRNTYDNEEIFSDPRGFERSNAVTDLTKEITDIYIDNCRSLLKLFNGQKQEESLTSAELHRNLGDWGDSLILLELVTSEDLESYVKKIRKCVELGDKKVQPVSRFA